MRAFPKPEGDLFPTLTAILRRRIGLIAATRSAWKQARVVRRPSRAISWLSYALRGGLRDLSPSCCCWYCWVSGLDGIGPLVDQCSPDRPPVLATDRRRRRVAGGLTSRSRDSPGVDANAARLRDRGGCSVCGRALVRSRHSIRRPPHRRPGSLRLSLLARARLRRPASSGAICDARHAVPRGRGRSRRSRRGEALRPGPGSCRSCFSLAVALRVIRRAHRAQRHQGRGRLRHPAAPGAYTGTKLRPSTDFSRRCQRPGTVLVEFPFGEPGYEVRYMFYSTTALASAVERVQRHLSVELRSSGARCCGIPCRTRSSHGSSFEKTAPLTQSSTVISIRTTREPTSQRGCSRTAPRLSRREW